VNESMEAPFVMNRLRRTDTLREPNAGENNRTVATWR
jgi:hypothetical protein